MKRRVRIMSGISFLHVTLPSRRTTSIDQEETPPRKDSRAPLLLSPPTGVCFADPHIADPFGVASTRKERFTMPSPPPTPAPPGMFARALLALGLLVGFYVLALGIAATLLLLPYLEVRYTQRIHLQVAIVCVLTAGTILYAVVPRPQRFK